MAYCMKLVRQTRLDKTHSSRKHLLPTVKSKKSYSLFAIVLHPATDCSIKDRISSGWIGGYTKGSVGVLICLCLYGGGGRYKLA